MMRGALSLACVPRLITCVVAYCIMQVSLSRLLHMLRDMFAWKLRVEEVLVHNIQC